MLRYNAWRSGEAGGVAPVQPDVHLLDADTLTEAELARARELVETKFGSPDWTARVP